jgi:SpoVK/Ycf46/Vps4 family AAA+-type ATPase
LRSHGIEPRHRVLLIGPPGNGKTSLAEALAYELSLPLYVVRYDTVIGSYLGETATRLRKVFDYARTTPCVLFFDEFDSIGKERGDIHETGEIKRVVSSLLLQMDDLPSYTVIVAATNHPELLDRAVWRRFQIQLTLGLPDKAQIAIWVERFSKRFQEPLGVSQNTFHQILNGENFAKIEQFGLDIQRQWILNMGSMPLREVAGRLVKRRQAALRQMKTDKPHGRKQAPDPVSSRTDEAEKAARGSEPFFDDDAGA